jgi:PAS domain S-box-containing protein
MSQTAALHRWIIDSATDFAIVATDLSGRVTTWNAGAELILGWSEAEMRGEKVDRFFTPEDLARHRPETEMRLALETGAGNDERWHIRKDGTRFWASGQMTVLRDEADTPLGFVKVLRDRTEQLLATEALRGDQANIRLLLDSMVEGFYAVDTQGVTTVCNAAFLRMMGFASQDEAVGRKLHDVIHVAHADGSAYPVDHCPIYRCARDGVPAHVEGEYFYPVTGGALPVEYWATPIVRGGVLQGAICTFLDVTDKVRAQRRQDALMEIVAASRDITTAAAMTATVSAIVGRALGVSRAGYGVVDADTRTIDIEPDWTTDGTASIAGRHRLEDFGRLRDELSVGEPLVIDDVLTDPRTAPDPAPLLALDVGALVNMPVRERGRTVAVFIVQSPGPRVWTKGELAFVRAVADRLEIGVARLRGEAQQAVLNAEIAHRLKNTLAMVQAIATQTLRRHVEPALLNAYVERLQALGTAHDALTGRDWTGAGLEDVVRGALRNVSIGDRCEVAGPKVILGARAALSTSLLLHELATNAIKYGALSGAGTVAIRWTIEEGEDADLVLEWIERGGPPASPPARQGFGSRLLRLGLVGTGGADLRYEASGLHARFRTTKRQAEEA